MTRILTAALAALVVVAPAAAFADDSRLELGLGIHTGDPELEYQGNSTELDTDTGFALSVRYWRDGLINSNLSFGAEYLHLNGGDYSENATYSGAISGTATLDLEPTINAFMANAAIRANGTEKFHPYAGLGAGLAWASVDLSVNGTLTYGGTTYTANGSDDDSDTALAWQLFAGADFDVTESIYIGAEARYFGTDVKLFDVDTEFRNFSAMAKLGYRF